IDRHPELGRRFNVQALPHDLLITPDGRILTRTEGYQPKATYLATVTRGETYFAKQILAQKPAQPASKPVAREQVRPVEPADREELASVSPSAREPFLPKESAAVRLNDPQA